MEDFEPTMVGLLCNWCAYTGADLAGAYNIEYPANIRIVRVMCSGMVQIPATLPNRYSIPSFGLPVLPGPPQALTNMLAHAGPSITMINIMLILSGLREPILTI